MHWQSQALHRNNCICQDGAGSVSDGHPHVLLLVLHGLFRQAAHHFDGTCSQQASKETTHEAPLITVPQGYAWEICTAEGGWGLHGILQGRQHVTNGITNGIDMDEWDPARDAHTPAPFSAADTSGKAACKAALQAELGFEVDARVHPCLRLIWLRLAHRLGPSDGLACSGR